MIYAIPIGILIFLAWAFMRLVRAGAWEDYKRAEWKCSKCPHYTGSNPTYRIIYCRGMARTPDECMECDQQEMEGK